MTRMLVTRPEPDAQATVMRLRALDIEADAAPLMRRVAVDTPLPPPEGFAALALTSANALRALADRGAVEAYRYLPVYAVGGRTAFEAEALGFARVMNADGALGDLVNLIVHAGVEGRVLHLAGRHLAGDLARSVEDHGIGVETVPIYEMAAAETVAEPVVAGLEAGNFAAALFYSRRTAEIFVRLMGERLTPAIRTGVEMLCLSEAVAEPLIRARCVRVSLTDHPDDEAMMTLALAFAREQNGA
jgi:uroporphyrinogen-III synthase